MDLEQQNRHYILIVIDTKLIDYHVYWEMEDICCIISIPSLYNIVVIDNFDFNTTQIDLIFRNFGIFLRTYKVILKLYILAYNCQNGSNGYVFS